MLLNDIFMMYSDKNIFCVCFLAIFITRFKVLKIVTYHLSDEAWLHFAKLKTEAAFSQLGFISPLKDCFVWGGEVGYFSSMQTIVVSVRLYGKVFVAHLVT